MQIGQVNMSSYTGSALCVLLGVVAFTLQGCGDSDHVKAFRAAAKDAGTAVVAAGLESAEGCPPLLAAHDLNKDKVVAKITESVQNSDECKADAKSEPCQKAMAFAGADSVMFYTEADPGFKAWTGDHADKWEKLKSTINTLLEHQFMKPMATMQGFIEVGSDITSDDSKSFLTKQLPDVCHETLKVFCPATDEEVAAAEAKDKPLVEQKEVAEEAAAKAQTEALKEEVLEEAASSGTATAEQADALAPQKVVAAEAKAEAKEEKTEEKVLEAEAGVPVKAL